MPLILARHGNTFGPGDKVVWCGARTDLPLVEKGLEQANAIGAALSKASIKPAAIVCGPLIRTRQTASAIAEKTGFPEHGIGVVESLREVDYGAWEGKSNDEIRAEFGPDDITQWQSHGIRPQNAGWKPDEATIRQNWDDLIASVRRSHGDTEIIVIVSSNGFFRFAASALGIDKGKSKMATGGISLVEITASGYAIRFWNKKPAEVSFPNP